MDMSHTLGQRTYDYDEKKNMVVWDEVIAPKWDGITNAQLKFKVLFEKELRSENRINRHMHGYSTVQLYIEKNIKSGKTLSKKILIFSESECLSWFYPKANVFPKRRWNWDCETIIQYYPYIKVLKGPAKFVYYIEGLLYWRFKSINNSSTYDIQTSYLIYFRIHYFIIILIPLSCMKSLHKVSLNSKFY